MALIKTYLKALSYLKAEFFTTIIICLANIILALVTIAEPILFGKIIYAIAHKQPYNTLITTMLAWISFGVFNIIAYVLIARSSDRLAHRQRLSVLKATYTKLLFMKMSWFQEQGVSNPMQVMLRACDTMFTIWLEFMRQHLATFVSLILLIPTAITLNWRLSAVLAVLAFIYILIARLVMNKTKQGQKNVEKSYHNVFSHITDTILNINVVQSYNRISIESNSLQKYMDELLNAQFPVLNWWALASGLNRMASTLSMVIVLFLGSLLVIKGEINIAEVITFVGFAQLMIGRLDQISGFINLAISSQAQLEEFFAMEKEALAVKEPDARITLPKATGNIIFKNVSFNYKNSNQGVYNIDFSIKAGQSVALVGSTGAGKTTIVNLLQRIYSPNYGEIFIDGVNIENLSIESLRENITTIFQDSSLFNRTIEENILIGNINATKQQIIKAATYANAHEFIKTKQAGYNSQVGERGALLSGGEKQRLAIARAILKDSPIWILDEATSALDMETEEKVKLAIEKVSNNRTTIIIAHRLSTIKHVDFILFIDNGRIVEQGSYADLAKLPNGRFAHLLKLSNITTS